jgi:DNA-binding response OmpR family regulator
MADHDLTHTRILIVEDEYFLADDLNHALSDAGAQVLGPIPTVDDARAFIAGEANIDAAILDINLHGEMVFPVADTLADRGIPFAFTTGYDQAAVPERFAGVPRIEKPFKGARIASILGPLLASRV